MVSYTDSNTTTVTAERSAGSNFVLKALDVSLLETNLGLDVVAAFGWTL